MKLSPFVRSRALRHGLMWGLVLALTGLLAILEPVGAPEKLRRMAVLLPVAALVIYAHFWALQKMLEQRHYASYVATTVGIMLSGAALLVLLNQLAHVVQARPGGPTTFAYLLGLAAGNLVLATVLATLPHYVRRGIVSIYQMQQLRSLQLETELSLLKAQINPHFFFNTLNNIYALTHVDAEQARAALHRLSRMMRYVLYESPAGQTRLSQELGFLRDYVELMHLRLTDKVQVLLQVPGPLAADPLIAPMLFQPFVENAFKHGVSATAPSCITIELRQPSAQTVELCVRNTVFPARPAAPPDDEPGGIGLANTQRRLDLLYPAAHTIRVVPCTAANEYEVCLHLSL